MQSRLPYIGFEGLYAGQRKSSGGFEEFEEEHDNELSTNYSTGNETSQSTSPRQINRFSSFDNHLLGVSKTTRGYTSSSSESYEAPQPLERRLCTPILSVTYTEIVTYWFKQQWLMFTDNHKETFLILDSNVTGCLTAQMAINQKSFINDRFPLLYQPECLLIRTEPGNKSLFLPNLTISLDPLFHRKNRSAEILSHGKLIAIICKPNEINSKLMFYKHSRRNQWYMFFNDPTVSSQSCSNMLSNEEQIQLESILESTNQANLNDSSQLPFSLSALCNHPIVYVYLTEK